MNWNGNKQYLNHWLAVRKNPNKAKVLQSELDASRKAKILAGLESRPVYLPLQFVMNAAGQISPYRDTTQALGYDVLIIGAKSDVQTRDVIVKRTENEKPLVYVGEQTNVFLRSDEIAGLTATTGGGQLGTFIFPSPIPLASGQRMTVEMFKTDTTADAETANIVFIAMRAMPANYADVMLDGDERASIDQLIALREIPSMRFLKQNVAFDSAVAGGVDYNIMFPRVPEPLLIRGFRTTLRHTTVELGIVGEPDWTSEATPVWAIAGEDELIAENYAWFPKPIYLHSDAQIQIRRAINGGTDGVNIDAQTGNTLTFIAETV